MYMYSTSLHPLYSLLVHTRTGLYKYTKSETYVYCTLVYLYASYWHTSTYVSLFSRGLVNCLEATWTPGWALVDKKCIGPLSVNGMHCIVNCTYSTFYACLYCTGSLVLLKLDGSKKHLKLIKDLDITLSCRRCSRSRGCGGRCQASYSAVGLYACVCVWDKILWTIS